MWQIPPALNVCGSFVIAALDGRLHRRRLGILTIQKLFTMSGAAIEAVFLCAFAAVLWVPRLRSPLYATLAYCGVIVGHLCHASGLFTNYQDVGGPVSAARPPRPSVARAELSLAHLAQDSSVIISVCNPLANVAGILVPAGARFFTQRSGSSAPYFVVRPELHPRRHLALVRILIFRALRRWRRRRSWRRACISAARRPRRPRESSWRRESGARATLNSSARGTLRATHASAAK